MIFAATKSGALLTGEGHSSTMLKANYVPHPDHVPEEMDQIIVWRPPGSGVPVEGIRRSKHIQFDGYINVLR